MNIITIIAGCAANDAVYAPKAPATVIHLVAVR
jgi:hypothetical protein